MGHESISVTASGTGTRLSSCKHTRQGQPLETSSIEIPRCCRRDCTRCLRSNEAQGLCTRWAGRNTLGGRWNTSRGTRLCRGAVGFFEGCTRSCTQSNSTGTRSHQVLGGKRSSWWHSAPTLHVGSVVCCRGCWGPLTASLRGCWCFLPVVRRHWMSVHVLRLCQTQHLWPFEWPCTHCRGFDCIPRVKSSWELG